MTVLKKSLGPVKRFGPRYGRTPKHKLAKIEIEQRKRHKCPYCLRLGVKRIGFGIWHCVKCDSKFTAGTYVVGKKTVLEEKAEQEVEEV